MIATAQPKLAEPAGMQKPIAWGLVTIFMTYFVYSYYFQIMLSSFPKIAASLGGMRDYSLGLSVPNLGLAFSMLIVGKLSDMYGRRALLLICMIVCLVGTVWCALSTGFVMLVTARTVLCIGQGGLAPLCFATIADMFEPVQRSRWVGLLNIPAGAFALIGPTLGGWFVDRHMWRYIFWCGVPLLIICFAMALFGLSGKAQHVARKIDSLGSLLAAIASSTLILGFSLAGTKYPWASVQVVGLLGVSILFWLLFIAAEARAEEPILDLQVLRNRSFVTIISACLLSGFGMAGLMLYYPLLIQMVQQVTATFGGNIMTPGMVLMNFIGVPTGFLLARTKRYKGMFMVSYGLTAVIMLGLISFNASTPIIWGFLAFTLAGISMGAVPTLNTLVAQYAVPRRLMGVATAALYFSVMIGQAIAPAILGSAMNMGYNSTLKANLPPEVTRSADAATMKELGDPNVLLSESAMASLRTKVKGISSKGTLVLDETVSAIRLSMESGLKIIFIIGAVAMVLTFLIICTIPEISIDTPVEEKTELSKV